MFRKLLLTIVLGFFAISVAKATHIAGGEIYYHCLGGNQYRITLVVYRDCAGVSLNNSYTLAVQSPCGNKTVNVSTPGGVEISQLCNLELPNSTCQGGTLPGIQQYIYTGTVTLPPCNYWTVSWSAPWRNGAIANLVNPGDKDVYIEARINNQAGPCDNSAQFTNTAIPFVCAGYPISYSYGAFDAQGDSLAYTFISAMNTGGVNLPYVSPHTGQQPIPGITLDPASGQVTFTLNQVGNWVVVVRVDQYNANGAWIGAIMRDMQFIAYPCSNVPPDPATGIVDALSGQATQTGPRAIEICESGNFCFDAVISDPNAGDVLTATTNIAQNLPGATITYSGTNPLTAHVCWSGVSNASGFFPFILTVSDGACPIPALQTYVYSVHVLPGLTLAAPDVIDESCAGNGDGSATVNVAVGTAPFQYAWSTGETTQGIVAEAGAYQVTVTDANGCVSHPQDVTIGEANQPASADAGPDLVGCLGDLPVLLSGSVANAPDGAWTGGAGNFGGSGLNASYAPTAAEIAAGGVDLYLTTTGDSPCGQTQDTVHIAFPNSFAGGQLGSTNLTCNGAGNGTASFTPANPGLQFLWNDPAAQTTATATGLAAGGYTLTVSDGFGCDTTLNAVIQEPGALAITDLVVVDETCFGNGTGSITATVQGGTAPYQYAWSTNDTGAVLHASAGTYSLTVVDAHNCAPVQGTATIDALGQPNAANAGVDLLACFSSLPVQLSGTVTNASGGTWSGGGGTFSNTGLQSTYMPTAAEISAQGLDLVLTTTGNTNCPPATDTVHLTLLNSFSGASMASSDLNCHGDHSGSAVFSPSGPGLSFLWNDPSAQTTATAMGLAAGTYAITVTDTHGCDTTATVSIGEPATLLADSIWGSSPTCAGQANGHATVLPVGGTPTFYYQWSANANGQTTPTAHGLPQGAYTVVVTDANGCQDQATVTLTDPLPVLLTAQVDDTVCVNTPVPLTAQASGGTGNHTVTWAGIGTGGSLLYSFPASQVVQVSVTDQNGCTGPILQLPVVVLDLSQATLHTQGDTAFCPGGTASVSAWVTGYPGPVSIAWPQIPATGNGPFNITASTSRNLDVTATDACANSLAATIAIAVETPPSISLPPIIAQGCAPLTVHFPTGLTNQPVTYAWQFGDGTSSTAMSPVHTYPAGTYTVSLAVTTPLGCTAAALNTGLVEAYAPPVAAFTADPWVTDADHADIQFTDQSSGAVSSWFWSFGDGGTSANPDPAYHYLEPGTWEVLLSVSDDHGCTATAAHVVQVDPLYDITLPNAFTPNPNGGGGGFFDPTDLGNDVFYPFVRFVKDFRFRIFNRWGELVFESNDVKKGWDGYYRGQLSQQDVYVYQLWVRFVDNKESQRTGDLTLFR
ncbi:MAG TPA: PKD domain-containing protein [Flavobacteriales bacterium]|nr:PKD domain-containing protein [Flavobacteriales bacterium]HRP81318.1 PKD domain-containing protein [Flavobacteriales bacterium]